MSTEDLKAKGMECTYHRFPSESILYDTPNPLSHFLGRLCRKGDCQDSLRWNPQGDEAGNPQGDDPCLACTCSCEYKKGP